MNQHAQTIPGRRGKPRVWPVRAGLVLSALFWFGTGLAVGAEGPTKPNNEAGVSGAATATRPAAEPGLENIDLLSMDIPMVITASRREQKVNTVPYAVSVITADDIQAAGARTVPDALRLAPGMDVADLASGVFAVSPRGFHGSSASEVLVLVDGRQIFDSLYGGTSWASWPFQLEDIDRIEVIRGPGGVTWGANTLNGVINIITKDPKNQTGLTMTGKGGSRGAQKEHIGYGFADGALRLRVSGEYEANDGFAKGGSRLAKLEDDYKAGRMGVHAIYDAGPRDTLTFSGGSGLLDGGHPTTPFGSIGSSRNAGSQANYLLGNWEHRLAEDNRINVTGYVNDFQHSPGLANVDYRYQQLALQVGQTFNPSENHTVTWGIDSRTDLMDASNSDPFMLSKDRISTAIIGLYVQDEWRFAPRWTLTLGGRIDYEFYGGFQPSARAALSYQLPDDSFIYGSVSRAFSMPPAGLRFLQVPEFFGLVYAGADRDMRAETGVTYELGYRKRFLERIETNVNLYWNEYDDLITNSPRRGPPGLMQAEYDNRASASSYGLELDVRYAVSRRLTLLGNYTYEQLDWEAAVPYLEKNAITPPRHKFMVGTRYDLLDDLHLSSYLYYVDAVWAPNALNPLAARHVPPYFRLDLRAEYEFWKKQASVAVGVRNLLDPNHYEGGSLAQNGAEVPRMVYAEMRVSLK